MYTVCQPFTKEFTKWNLCATLLLQLQKTLRRANMNLAKFQDLTSETRKYESVFNIDKLYRYLINQRSIKCVNDNLLVYHKADGCYYFIDPANEWHVLSFYFSDDICDGIKSEQVSELLKRLKNTRRLQLDYSELNNSYDLMNTKRSVLNYLTCEEFEKNAEYRFTSQVNATYIPNSTIEQAPYFLSFCETSLGGDTDKIQLLLEIIGYLCSPITNAKKAFFLLGEPNCGKSIF